MDRLPAEAMRVSGAKVGHAVRNAPHLFGIVRYQQDGHVSLERRERIIEPARGGFVEATRGLVDSPVFRGGVASRYGATVPAGVFDTVLSGGGADR